MAQQPTTPQTPKATITAKAQAASQNAGKLANFTRKPRERALADLLNDETMQELKKHAETHGYADLAEFLAIAATGLAATEGNEYFTA